MNHSNPLAAPAGLGTTLERAGGAVIRYGLVAILLWIGSLKFTAYEAKNIEPLVANSPLMAWAHAALGLRGLSGLIGGAEILFGLLIASRPWSPVASAVGGFGAVGMFLTTLTFVVTTPGVWEPGYGFPYPSGSPGQFLLKDLLFLGVAIRLTGESLTHVGRRTAA